MACTILCVKAGEANGRFTGGHPETLSFNIPAVGTRQDARALIAQEITKRLGSSYEPVPVADTRWLSGKPTDFQDEGGGKLQPNEVYTVSYYPRPNQSSTAASFGVTICTERTK